MAATNADNNADNTSKTSDISDTSSPPPPALPETEALGEGEFFTTTECGIRKFYRLTQFDRTNKNGPGKKSSLQSKGIVKKKKKDANAPKRALSSYFLFMKKNRAVIQAELEKNGLKGKELNTSVVKMSAERWKVLSEEEKKEFNDLHLQHKQRYIEEMKSYQPPAVEDETA